MKRVSVVFIILLVVSMLLASCSKQSEVASRNLSNAADQFQIVRKVFFYNGITGEYIYTMEGLCSIKDQTVQLEVTCKLGPNQFVKHFQGLSDNITYTVIQVSPQPVDEYQYKMYIRPETVIPDLELDLSIIQE